MRLHIVYNNYRPDFDEEIRGCEFLVHGIVLRATSILGPTYYIVTYQIDTITLTSDGFNEIIYKNNKVIHYGPF